MAKKVAKQTTKVEGVLTPSISNYRLIKDLNGNLNGKEMKYLSGDEVKFTTLEAFVYRDWLEKL